jgi:phosphoribosylaminoimidazolecarboxamide formyltransferase/IMP cyclohydrolase
VSPQKYALVSTWDKTGIVEFGKVLCDAGYTILSTGGTARALEAGGLEVTRVSDHTGAPELCEGRVKTLHPRIHAGILGDRRRHADEVAAQDIPWIDVVVCNLYPFEEVTRGDVSLDTAVEHIDIGGPTMVRAAAKNHRDVLVVVKPGDYARVGDALQAGEVDDAMRRALAVRAFRHVARYDSVVSSWLARGTSSPDFPDEWAVGLRRKQGLRYGENPHQRATFYADSDTGGRSLARATQHQGKELSFNNLADLDGALRAVFSFPDPASVVVKHMNPCGAATSGTLPDAFRRALAGDPVSAYGGIVVFNRSVDADTIEAVKASKTFFEVLAAPGFSSEALTLLEPRKKLRVLELPDDWGASSPPGMDARRVQGGWLFQDWDLDPPFEERVVTQRQPTEEEWLALRFAWRACRSVKSNAIVLARGDGAGACLNGVGAGQMSRVDAVKLAISKATT